MIDATNASRTLLMDLRARAWHTPTLQRLRIPPGLLPRIVSSAEVYGAVKAGALAGVPIAGCAPSGTLPRRPHAAPPARGG